MTKAPILAYLNYDQRFFFYTNVFYQGLDFILAQKDERRKEHLVRYRGRKLRPSEQNYTITDLKYLGIV